jgi:ferredoxin
VVLYGTEVYEKAKHDITEISPEETKRLIEQLVEEGCMQTFYACMRSQGWMVVICNCEGEICVPFRCHQLVGGVLHPGPDIIECCEDLCIKCGKCVERCHFGVNRLENGAVQVEFDKCYGCGICVSSCPAEARRLAERENYINMYYPLDFVARSLEKKESPINK